MKNVILWFSTFCFRCLDFWPKRWYFRKSLHFWPKRWYFRKSLHFWLIFDILLCSLQNSLFSWIRESKLLLFLFQNSFSPWIRESITSKCFWAPKVNSWTWYFWTMFEPLAKKKFYPQKFFNRGLGLFGLVVHRFLWFGIWTYWHSIWRFDILTFWYGDISFVMLISSY